MVINIDLSIAKILRYMQQNTNILFQKSYDYDKIVGFANYICKKNLPYENGAFVLYMSQLNFPKETIDVYVKEIEKAMKRRSHPIKALDFDYILSKEE